MRKLLAFFCAALLAFSGCAADKAAQPSPAPGLSFEDSLGREVTVSSLSSVVSLYGSFAEAWTLSGGSLSGATADAVEERKMELGDAKIVGTVKNPDFEAVLALDPDFVILSADIAGQTALDAALTEAKIPHAYFRVDTYKEYVSMMEIFSRLTGRDDLFEKNAASVARSIEALLASVPEKDKGTEVLLVRAYSTGAKSKGSDSLAGAILKDLGCVNIADSDSALLDNLSIEKIIASDPDFIFVVTMGADSAAAVDALTEQLRSSSAWEGLTAVREGRFVVLPQELFHYKPNARWGESYEYLEKILYG